MAAFGGIAYWFITQFNSIKYNDNKLHANLLEKLSETNSRLLGGQDIMNNFQKELNNIKRDVEKLSDNISRDVKTQTEKFIRIDDKISDLQADVGRSMSDTLIHLEHLGKTDCKFRQ